MERWTCLQQSMVMMDMKLFIDFKNDQERPKSTVEMFKGNGVVIGEERLFTFQKWLMITTTKWVLSTKLTK
jgi:hypothetical protein